MGMDLARRILPLLPHLAPWPGVVAQEAASGPPALPRELQERVNRAIDRGVGFLLGTQLADGSWEYLAPEYGGGHTALVVFTLLRSGVRAEHPAVRQALAWLAAEADNKTYALSCRLLAWHAAGRKEDRRLLERDLRTLLANQDGPGLFRYPDEREADLSNAVFAALGLQAAARAGLRVPAKTWQRLAQATLACRGPKEEYHGGSGRPQVARGFGYHPGRPPTGSMTTAGITVLALAREALGRRAGRLGRDAEAAITEAVRWLAGHWALEANPAEPEAKWHYYWLYGLERVGSLLELEEIGEHAWYPEGAAWLVAEQRPDGSWHGRGREGHAEVDTCLALLFLKRATAAVAVTGAAAAAQEEGLATRDPRAAVRIRASGDTPLSVWIAAFGPQAAALCWPGEEEVGPRVRRVLWEARRPGPRGGEVLTLAEVPGDPAQPVARPRFAARLVFPESGRWLLQARVEVALPPREGAAEGGGTAELRSPPLLVEIEEVLEDWRLEQATGRRRNLLDPAAVTAEASSELGPGERAELAADGWAGTAWVCSPEDEAPWIRLRLRRPVKADTLVLTHAWNKAFDRGRPRARRVRVLLDGKEKDALTVELAADPRRSTVIPLEGVRRLRLLEIRILDLRPGQPGRDPAGFAEIHLERRGE